MLISVHLACRVLGHVAFRAEMLGHHGTVLVIPFNQGRSSVESVAGDIKAAVEAKTSLPLDAFRYGHGELPAVCLLLARPCLHCA